MSHWPYTSDMQGTGALGEWELDAACWRKRSILLTRDQCLAVDETAGLCGHCGGECETPQACEVAPSASPRQPRFAFLLADAFERAPGRTMLIVCAVVLALYGVAGKLDQLAAESIELHADTDEVQP